MVEKTENSLKYSLHTTSDLVQRDLEQLLVLGDAYEQDIGGVDLGFGSLLDFSTVTFLLYDGKEQVVGFFLGTDKMYTPLFEGEKEVYLIAAYLKPEYRKKAGREKDVLEKALGGLVDALEERGYDRLDVFPPNSMLRHTMVTDVGMQKVLRTLHNILLLRMDEPHAYLGDPMKYVAGYLFRQDDYQARSGLSIS